MTVVTKDLKKRYDEEVKTALKDKFGYENIPGEFKQCTFAPIFFSSSLYGSTTLLNFSICSLNNFSLSTSAKWVKIPFKST